MRKGANPSWVIVIELALEKMAELRLANKLREKYCAQQQITRSNVELSDSEAAERMLMVDRKDMVCQGIEGLGETYIPVLRANEIAVNLDNEALNILNKAVEKMLVEKTESFISAQYKELNKILPSRQITLGNTF